MPFDRFAHTESQTELIEDLIDAETALRKMTTKQRRVVYLYALGHSRSEIAEIQGVTKQAVSKILRKIGCQNS